MKINLLILTSLCLPGGSLSAMETIAYRINFAFDFTPVLVTLGGVRLPPSDLRWKPQNENRKSDE